MNSIINLGALVFLIVAGMRKSGFGRIIGANCGR